MNLRDTAAYGDSHWDWTPLNECFYPTKIRVGDSDGARTGYGEAATPKGMVERHGRFLFLETKRPGEQMRTGQRVFYTELAAVPAFKVLLITGHPNQPQAYQDFPRGDPLKGGWPELQTWVRHWFLRADRLGRLPRAA